VGRFPQLAVLLQGRVVVGGQLGGQVGVQGSAILGGAAWNRFDGEGACFPALPHIPFEGGPRDLEQRHDLGTWGTLIDRMQDTLAEVG
jgi:hypothetical protein